MQEAQYALQHDSQQLMQWGLTGAGTELPQLGWNTLQRIDRLEQ
jgi:hypothetical protein